MPPSVRSLKSLIAEQTKAITPQQQLIDQSIQQNDASGAAQIAGLGAQKDTAFSNIEQGAQNKGMYFSGFSPDEQAKYTAGTYLPALAQLQGTIAQTRNSLLGKKADLNTDVFKTASNIREADLQALRDWNKMTAEQKFNASEAEKQRAFEAQQKEADRRAAAAEGAAGRAAAAAQSRGAPAGLVGSISDYFNKYKGGDQFVSPETYRNGMQQWVKEGGSPDSFNQTFSAYINPVHQATFGGYY